MRHAQEIVLVALAVAFAWQIPAAGDDRETQPAPLGLCVPAYFYPNGPGLREWERLMATAKDAPTIAIVNPNSGPGDHRDTNYAALLPRARKAGVTVVGYVATQYARKPLEKVKGEVDTFLRFYPEIQGIHFDEQNSDAKHVDYYAELYRHLHKRIPKAVVMSNPGTVCAPEYLERPAADIVCLFERDRPLAEYRPPAWTSRFPASRFSVLSYQVDTEEQMRQAIEQTAKSHAGHVYITDDRGRNPYDRLPTYWEAEVEAVRRANQAAKR